MHKIGSLPPTPHPAIYQRADGRTFLKLHPEFHVRVAVKGKSWVAQGNAERLDPDETVTVINDRTGA